MLGGQDSKNINDFWKFDLNTYMWTELPNPSSLVSKVILFIFTLVLI